MNDSNESFLDEIGEPYSRFDGDKAQLWKTNKSLLPPPLERTLPLLLLLSAAPLPSRVHHSVSTAFTTSSLFPPPQFFEIRLLRYSPSSYPVPYVWGEQRRKCADYIRPLYKIAVNHPIPQSESDRQTVHGQTDKRAHLTVRIGEQVDTLISENWCGSLLKTSDFFFPKS